MPSLLAASGFVARETIEFSNLTVANQAFGQHFLSYPPCLLLFSPFRDTGVVTNSNVSMVDNVSGMFGLGFTRLSGIANAVVNG
jgi:hypothetical protein